MKDVWKQILHKEDMGILSPVLSKRGELGLVCVKCEALYNLTAMGVFPTRMRLTDDLTLYSNDLK